MLESTIFLTTECPGIGGVIKTCDEDFFVEEKSLYQPSGDGTHAYFLIEKRGVGTREAVSRIARTLNVRRLDIGYAGLKDARAVTRQWMSVEHVPVERIESLNVPNVRVLQVTRHTNKLKPGRLAGNRFAIRLRQPKLPLDQAARIAEQVLAVLSERGTPNYYGPQRFGRLRINHRLGKAVAHDRAEDFMDLFLGRARDTDETSQARVLYDQGRYQDALELWPLGRLDKRRVLKALVQAGGDKKAAFRRVDRHLKGLFVSAYQSWLFNRILTARMPEIDTLLTGDMAYLHGNGACFPVDDADLEQPRCARFEISPTGPLLGRRTRRLTGPAGAIENPILDREELGEPEFKRMQKLGAPGGRRPLRFQPRHIDISFDSDENGPYLLIRFELDPGCYATTVMSEIMKNDSSQDDRK